MKFELPDDSQFIDRQELEPLAIVLVWLFGFLIPLVVSTVGNYVTFAGGWDNLEWTLVQTWGYALLYQLFCTLAQFGFKAQLIKRGLFTGWGMAYVVALLISAVPSFLSYNPIIWGIVGETAKRYTTETQAIALVGLIAGLFAILVDMMPEWCAVRE